MLFFYANLNLTPNASSLQLEQLFSLGSFFPNRISFSFSLSLSILIKDDILEGGAGGSSVEDLDRKKVKI